MKAIKKRNAVGALLLSGALLVAGCGSGRKQQQQAHRGARKKSSIRLKWRTFLRQTIRKMSPSVRNLNQWWRKNQAVP